MISVSQALSILSEYVVKAGTETVGLQSAIGRELSENVNAELTLPPHDASAMDGYAVRLEDVKNIGAALSVIGEVPAGHNFDAIVGAGEAVRIFTGSPIPKGANHIIIQENVVRDGNLIHVITASDTSRHIRCAGIDFTKGGDILKAGQILDEANIAIAAASNHTSMPVFKRPKLSILAAGDELVPVGAARETTDIVNSNSSTLTALINLWGGAVQMSGLTKDDPEAIRAMFSQASNSDIIVPVGGASVGDYDHMRSVFTELNGKMIFEKIAVKPGKPTWFGVLNGTPVLGLPGNPAAAIVCAHLFLKPLMGGPLTSVVQAFASENLPSNGPRETYLRARLWAQEGKLHVKPFSRQDSSLLSTFQSANVLIRRAPHAEEVKAGVCLDVIDLGTGPSPFFPLT